MANKIQFKRGLKQKLPTLALGEPGLCTDTNEIFVGGSNGNIGLATASQLAGVAQEAQAAQAKANAAETPNGAQTKVNNAVGPLSSLLTTAKGNTVVAINELFTNVSNGKNQVAAAITGKGVAASGSDSFGQLAGKIGQIQTETYGIIPGIPEQHDFLNRNTTNMTYALTTLPANKKIYIISALSGRFGEYDRYEEHAGWVEIHFVLDTDVIGERITLANTIENTRSAGGFDCTSIIIDVGNGKTSYVWRNRMTNEIIFKNYGASPSQYAKPRTLKIVLSVSDKITEARHFYWSMGTISYA